MSEDTFSMVVEVVSQTLDVDADKIKPETSFVGDLGADSLAVMDLLIRLEEKFDIKIDDDDSENIKTVGDAVAHIDKLRS